MKFGDRCYEYSTTTGTGTLSLSGTFTRFQTLDSGIATGSFLCYAIQHESANEWEVGLGVVTSGSPDTMTRVKVLGGSNGTSLVSFSSGTKRVFSTFPAILAEGAALHKAPVRVATTANGTLSTAFANGQTVDGVTLATGDRILLKDQSTASQNGIYVVAASGAPTRATDLWTGDSARGAMLCALEGTTNAGRVYACTTTAGSDVVGTNNLTWTLLMSGVYQPLDATLTALAAYNTNGLLTQTAADTFTGRTITGTSNKIDVTNGDGVSGNPTLTISATYVGQTSITTLGTIATGVWSGTAIGLAKGGTNADLSGTGGTSQFLRQSSSGAAITVSAIAATDIAAALSSGLSGGQTLKGDTASGGNLTFNSTSHATKGKILFGSVGAIDEANTRLGIGTTSPSFALDVRGVSGAYGATAALYGYDAATSTTRPTVSMRAARGTPGSEAAIQSDYLGAVGARGYGATAYGANDTALILFQATATFTDTSQPSRIRFLTTGASEVAASDVMVISASKNVGIGNIPTFGSSAVYVLAIANGTAPGSSPADEVQLYSADQTSGNACLHTRTENGSVIKLYKTGTYTPTNVTTDRSYDADATSVDELADVLGTLIADLQLTGLIG